MEILLKMNENNTWEMAKTLLKSNVDATLFSDWFSNIELVGAKDDNFTLGTDGEFAAMWVNNNYLDIIRKHLCLATGRSVQVKIIPLELECPKQDSLEETEVLQGATYIKPPAQAPAIDPRNTFENFVVGETNQFPYEASFAVAKAPGVAYNPLLIYGASGTGKTHLMHAIAHFIFKNDPTKNIVYISSERFVNEYLTALSSKEIAKFRQSYRNVDVLLIDDIQFFSGKESCQNEFFHTFNDLFNQQKQIVLSCDKPLSEVPKLEQRLVTRFEWGISVDIQPPDYETRLNILTKKAQTLGVNIDPAILDLIAQRITKNVRRLEGALNKVTGYLSFAKEIDIDTARKILSDTFANEDENTHIGIDLIQSKVAEFYKIDLAEITSKRRTANIALARQIAMYIARKHTTYSLQEIGRRFGNRDHGTVMHAIKTVADAMENDTNLRRNVDYLLKLLSF